MTLCSVACTQACAQIAELTGARCTGIDLSPGNIERANAMAAARPDLDLHFEVGNFTAVPQDDGIFTHVIAQETLVYTHGQLPKVFGEIKRVLAPGGLAVINDYLGQISLRRLEITASRHVSSASSQISMCVLFDRRRWPCL